MNNNDTPSAIIFKVQLKGSHGIIGLKGRECFSFPFYVSKLRYYLNIEIPVVLVIVDTESEKMFWRTIQNDTDLLVAIEKAEEKPHEKLSVRLSMDRTIQDNIDTFLDELNSLFNWLRLNAIKRVTMPIEDVLRHTSAEHLESLLKSSKNTRFHLYNV